MKLKLCDDCRRLYRPTNGKQRYCPTCGQHRATAQQMQSFRGSTVNPLFLPETREEIEAVMDVFGD
ncbi:MAG: hypothetical protein WA003_15730 [Desulfuromonadaceae bacterium]